MNGWIVDLWSDLAIIREDTYARLVAEHGPQEAARLWQLPKDTLNRRRGRSTGGAEPHVAVSVARTASVLSPDRCPFPAPGEWSGAGEPVSSQTPRPQAAR